MVEKINTLCDQIYEDIQNLRESGNYEVEKRLGVEIMALNALSNAYAKTGQNLVHQQMRRSIKSSSSRYDHKQDIPEEYLSY